MRKYLIGGIVGFILAFAGTAHAEVVDMIGKVVDGVFNVKVGDKTLGTPAIVIEGTSYLPVSAFGEATGYDVSFDANLGITLTPKKVTQQPWKPQSDALSKAYRHISTTNIQYSGTSFSNSNGDYGFIDIDGNQYVTLSALSGPFDIDWKKPTAEFKAKNKESFSINVSATYSTNADGFVYNGTSYVKLSALGLKATINGETLMIDTQ